MQSITNYIEDKKFIKSVQFTIIILFLSVIAFDIYLALDKIDNNTISNIIQNYTDNGLFVLTYFWGILAANFFITTKSPLIVRPVFGTIIVVIIALLMVFFNIEPKVNAMMGNDQYYMSNYGISMLFGLLMGLLFWRQHQN
jgi:hypothetical protein